MVHLFNRNAIAGYLGMSLVAATWIAPDAAMAETDRQMICGDTANYVKRRLGSGQSDNLCQVYKGKVMLVVNTASRCAFTDQYEDLQQLYGKYRDRGFVVIGFPSNQFANQEPGTEKSIKNFCTLTYNVEFPMYAKTKVRGDDADPFYKALAEAAGEAPRWNFHKYLIDRGGALKGSYGSRINPQSSLMVQDIERLF